MVEGVREFLFGLPNSPFKQFLHVKRSVSYVKNTFNMHYGEQSQPLFIYTKNFEGVKDNRRPSYADFGSH